MTTDAPEPPEASIARLERTVDRFSEWARFGDAKAAGVIVLLGLGLADLLDHAARLVHAHRLPSRAGDIATVALVAALILAVLVVIQVSRALFPRVRATTNSAFFFGSVAEYGSGTEYLTAFLGLTRAQAAEQLSEQVWEIARIASHKFGRTRSAYWFVLAFLAVWAIARTALAIAS
jgi:hypothetical protein